MEYVTLSIAIIGLATKVWLAVREDNKIKNDATAKFKFDQKIFLEILGRVLDKELERIKKENSDIGKMEEKLPPVKNGDW